jgi:oligoribonuclease
MSNSKQSASTPNDSNSRSTNLIWIDLEMTGLEPEHDTIIEIATIVTDANLNLIAEGPSLAVHQSDAALAAMDEWCTRQHGQSGLTQRVRESLFGERDAELQTLAFLQQHVDQGASPMCGNSIGQDRRFLDKYMPELEAFFHYRNLDVSTLKELARRWKPEVLEGVKKQGSHLALDDIRDSINELSHYRQHFIKL